MNEPQQPPESDNDRHAGSGFRHILAGIPGILSVGELRYFPSPALDIFPGEKVVELHNFAADHEHKDEVEWLKHVLSVEKVSGEFYLLCNRISEPQKWARVALSDGFEWVGPLWALSRGMYFMPVDVSYFLEVISEETIARVYRTR